MKISVLIPHMKAFGGVRHFVEVGNILARQGHEYTIYTESGQRPDWIAYHGQVQTLAQARAIRHEVVITGDTGLLPVIKEISARKKIIYVLGPRYVKNYREYFDTFPTWIGISTDWTEYCHLPEKNKAYTNLLGINTSVFRPRPNADKDESIRLLCFGRIKRSSKGVRDVLKAFRMIRHAQVKLMMYDSAPIPLPWWMSRKRIERYVGLAQTELADLYNKADIFISAETSAGWSNPSAEAMACCTAVVCTTCGTRDLADHGQTALVVPAHNPQAIRDAVKELIDSPDLRNQLAQNAYQKIQPFTWSAHCNRLMDIINKAKT